MLDPKSSIIPHEELVLTHELSEKNSSSFINFTTTSNVCPKGEHQHLQFS